MPLHLIILLVSVSFSPFLSNNALAEETLTWSQCIAEAAKNHPDLIAAQEEIKQAQAAKSITASALYPQIDANLSASTARTSTGAGKKTIADSYSYGISGTQLIFDGFKTVDQVMAGTENVKASKQNFRFVSATVRFRLKSAFIALLKAQQGLQITQEIYNIRRENFELITLRYESGLEHKGALLTAEADLADAQYGVSQAQRQLEVAQRELAKEMGRKKLSFVTLKGGFEVKDSAEKKPDLEFLAKSHPSLQQAIAKKNAADFNLRAAYAEFFPTLTGEGGANKSGTRWQPRGNEWDIGLELSMPIFEGGLRFAQVSKAKGALEQLKENERSTKDGIVLTLEETWAALQDGIENAQVKKKSLNATEERSRIAQAQYSTGFITFDNWIIIEDNLVRAKKDFLDAQADALFAEAEWVRAKGVTLEYD